VVDPTMEMLKYHYDIDCLQVNEDGVE